MLRDLRRFHKSYADADGCFFCGSDASREAGYLAATASIVILLSSIVCIFLMAKITANHVLLASQLASLSQKQELRGSMTQPTD